MSRLSRRTDEGGGNAAATSAIDRPVLEGSESLGPKSLQAQSRSSEADSYLQAAEPPTSTQSSLAEPDSTTSSQIDNEGQSPFDWDHDSRVGLTTIGSLIDFPQDDSTVSLLEEEASSIDQDDTTTSPATPRLSLNSSSLSGDTRETAETDDIHLVRSRESPFGNSTSHVDSGRIYKSKNATTPSSQHPQVRRLADVTPAPNSTGDNKHSLRTATISVSTNQMDPADYDDFDLDYQLKLNSSGSLPVDSILNYSDPLNLGNKRPFEASGDPQTQTQLPSWSSVVGSPSHLFEAGTSALSALKSVNLTADPAAVSSIGPVPSVLTLHSNQLTNKELNTIRPHLLSLYQDLFEPNTRAIQGLESNQLTKGDLLATASFIDSLSPGSVLMANGSLAPTPNMSNLIDGEKRDSIISLFNGSPIVRQKQRDFPSVGADEHHPSSTTSSTTSTTSTTATPSTNPKGSSENHWFNYPHPRIHHNPLLLHHLLNKPALYNQQLDSPNDQNQTTTTTTPPIIGPTNQPEAPTTRSPQLALNSLALATIERPTLASPSRSYQATPVNQTQLEMQLEELRYLANRQKQQAIRTAARASAGKQNEDLSATGANSLILQQGNTRTQSNPASFRPQTVLPSSLLVQPLLLNQAERKLQTGKPLEMASQLITAPTLLQEIFESPKQQQQQNPNRWSASNPINQQATSLQAHILHPPLDSASMLDERLIKMLELRDNPPSETSASKFKSIDLRPQSMSNDDRMSTFVSQLSTAFSTNGSQNTEDPRSLKANLMLLNKPNGPSPLDLSRARDQIRLFSLTDDEQSQLYRDLPFLSHNTTRSNHQNQRLNFDPATRVLALPTLQRVEPSKDKSRSAYHGLSSDQQIPILDLLNFLTTHQASNKFDEIRLLSLIKLLNQKLSSVSSSNITSPASPPTTDLHSLAAELAAGSAHSGRDNHFDDLTTAGSSRGNLSMNHERQQVQESLLVESSRLNPFSQSQRSSYFGPMQFPYAPSYQFKSHGPTYASFAPPTSFPRAPQALMMQPSYQVAVSQSTQMPQPARIFTTPVQTFASPQVSQSRPALPLIAAPPLQSTLPDPAKMLADRFPFVSAPAYLIKLPTLTGGTITASGSFQTPASFLRNRGVTGSLHLSAPGLPQRMRMVTSTVQPITLGPPAPGLPIQPAPSGLHPLHHPPPAHFHQPSPMLSHEPDQFISPTSPAANFHSNSIYGPTPMLYDQSQHYMSGPYMPPARPPVVNPRPSVSPMQGDSTTPQNPNEFTHEISPLTTAAPSVSSNPMTTKTPQSNSLNQLGASNVGLNQLASVVGVRPAGSSENQAGSLAIHPTAAAAALSRLQQATASLVEITSLASLVDEILSSSDPDPSPGAALMKAINNLSAVQANSPMAAQASSSTGTINDMNQHQSLVSAAWKNLINAGVLWRDKLNNGTSNKAKLERLVASAANRKPTTKLRVKYIRVPIAVYENSNIDGSSSAGDSSGNDLVLTTKEPISAKSFLGQVSLPAVSLRPDSISDQIQASKTLNTDSTGSGISPSPSSFGGIKAASSDSYIFDEINPESNSPLAVSVQDLLSDSSISAESLSFSRPPDMNPMILGLPSRKPTAVPLLLRKAPLALTTSSSPLLTYYSLMSSPSSSDMIALDSIEAMRDSDAMSGGKRGKKRAKGKAKKELLDDDEDEEASDDDLMSAEDLSLLESLISTVAHPNGFSSHHYGGDNYRHVNSVNQRAPHIKGGSSPWRLRGALGALRGIGADSSNQVETYAPAPSSVSSSTTAATKDFATSLLKHSNRLSLSEIIGALGARKIIMSLLNKRKASRTSKRAVEQGAEIPESTIASVSRKGSKTKPNQHKENQAKGTPSMYPYIGTLDVAPSRTGEEQAVKQHQAAMNMIINRSKQHSQRNDTHSKLVEAGGETSMEFGQIKGSEVSIYRPDSEQGEKNSLNLKFKQPERFVALKNPLGKMNGSRQYSETEHGQPTSEWTKINHPDKTGSQRTRINSRMPLYYVVADHHSKLNMTVSDSKTTGYNQARNSTAR